MWLPSYFSKRRENWRGRLVTAHQRALCAAFGARSLPLGYWKTMRALARGLNPVPDALSPPAWRFKGDSSGIHDPALRDMLQDDELGTWALDASVVNFLWKELKADGPCAIVEFGAGVSTVLFAKYASANRASTGRRTVVLTLEQHPGVRDMVAKRLSALGLAQDVFVEHAPLDYIGRYQIDPSRIEARLQRMSADWVLVDGPAGHDGCRVHALPLILPFCSSGTRWFLDDALRDGEIAAMAEWSVNPELRVQGIYPVGKGLGTGTVMKRAHG